MRRFAVRWNACALGAIALSLGGSAASAQAPALVLDHVTVVDVRTGALSRNRAVVIEDGRIVRIEAAGARVDGARRIDEHGRFVVPGYNDMHAHNLNEPAPEISLPLMLANGVTGFRQMAGSPELLAARAAGHLLPPESPALLALPGNLLAGKLYFTPQNAVAEVARQKQEGADFIKIIDVPPVTYLAAADAARAAGLPLAGHLVMGVNPRDAMQHGMASIEHLGPGITQLISCSSDEAAIRARIAAMPILPPTSDVNDAGAEERRMIANPILGTPPQAFGLMRHVLATYDPAKCRAFADFAAASGTWQVATLSRLEAMELGDTPALKNNPNLRYVPASEHALWNDIGQEFAMKITPDQRQTLVELFAAQLRLAKLFDDAHVKMMAGTDFGGQWLVSGFSLHHEFDLYAKAGFSPLRVLQLTTIDPAVFLHREATMGSVEPGRNADLVLLDADPTAAVANLHHVVAVVRAGKYYDRSALDAIESREAAAAATH